MGITFTNFEKFGLHRLRNMDQDLVPLNEMDLVFYREAVFLLKTYFFIYLGISIHFGQAYLALVAAIIVLPVYLMRLLLTRFIFRAPDYSLRDAAITLMLAPGGWLLPCWRHCRCNMEWPAARKSATPPTWWR